MKELTIKKIKKEFKKEFSEESLNKFYKFLEERKQTNLYFIAVVNNYNKNREVPVSSFKNDVHCSWGHESELGSCFVDFNKSEEGREFWVEFNKDWQTYRKSNKNG